MTDSLPSNRSVWVLAKPIDAAGPFSFLSEGKWPLCHWGVLVSEYSTVDMRIMWLSRKEMHPGKTLSWGVLFELWRSPNHTNTPHMVTDFDKEYLVQYWPVSSITFVGETKCQDQQLLEEGMYEMKVWIEI